MKHVKKAREQHGFANAGTLDGMIMFKGNESNQKCFILKWFLHNSQRTGKNLCLFVFLLCLGFNWGVSWLIFKLYFFIFRLNLSHWRSTFNAYKIKNCLILFLSIANVSLIKKLYIILYMIFAKTRRNH